MVVTVPVITGLAVGIAFVVAFSILAGPSLTGVVTEDYNHINLAIGGLKSTYESGEPIIISVTAKGISDNACNISSPSVYMRDESNDGKIIYWPNPFALYTAIKCAGPEPIDKMWTDGDDAKKIVLDKPGSYTLIASLEDVTIEKRFSVQ